MIAYVKGTVEDIAEDNTVVDVGGIGYNVRISADTAARLPGIGEIVKHLHQRAGGCHTALWLPVQK